MTSFGKYSSRAGALVLLLLAWGAARADDQLPTDVALAYFEIPSYFDAVVKSGLQEDMIKKRLLARYEVIVGGKLLDDIRKWVSDSSLQSEDFSDALATTRSLGSPQVIDVRYSSPSRVGIKMRFAVAKMLSESRNLESIDSLVRDYKVASASVLALRASVAEQTVPEAVWFYVISSKLASLTLQRTDHRWLVTDIFTTTEVSTADIVSDDLLRPVSSSIR